jgi:hypothetical protein
MAESCFPGIQSMYRRLRVKPATFLQLVWLYEGRRRDLAGRALRAAAAR